MSYHDKNAPYFFNHTMKLKICNNFMLLNQLNNHTYLNPSRNLRPGVHLRAE